jgi:alcohol dehydrogenase
VLLITGDASFAKLADFSSLMTAWRAAGLQIFHERVSGEPSPDWVDACVARHAQAELDLVLAIGGGSAIDAAKAVAGLLPVQESVLCYLEGLGIEKSYTGQALPLIAVPTTAGTGAEATKNAVLSRHGAEGFKKSFRHESLMPVWAVIDPEWMLSLSPVQIAGNGLDAITQLIEGYTSTRANPLTDALALQGLRLALSALPRWVAQPECLACAQDMGFAALASGMVLAHTGLGAVHGMAAPLGAFFPAPHGMVCGLLLAETTRANLHALAAEDVQHPALARYAQIGRLLPDAQPDWDDAQANVHLLNRLFAWQAAFSLPTLADFGMTAADIARVVANSRGNSMKTNPVFLSDAVLGDILTACLCSSSHPLS